MKIQHWRFKSYRSTVPTVCGRAARDRKVWQQQKNQNRKNSLHVGVHFKQLRGQKHERTVSLQTFFVSALTSSVTTPIGRAWFPYVKSPWKSKDSQERQKKKPKKNPPTTTKKTTSLFVSPLVCITPLIITTSFENRVKLAPSRSSPNLFDSRCILTREKPVPKYRQLVFLAFMQIAWKEKFISNADVALSGASGKICNLQTPQQTSENVSLWFFKNLSQVTALTLPGNLQEISFTFLLPRQRNQQWGDTMSFPQHTATWRPCHRFCHRWNNYWQISWH